MSSNNETKGWDRDFARDQDVDKEVNCPKLADNGPSVVWSVTNHRPNLLHHVALTTEYPKHVVIHLNIYKNLWIDCV